MAVGDEVAVVVPRWKRSAGLVEPAQIWPFSAAGQIKALRPADGSRYGCRLRRFSATRRLRRCGSATLGSPRQDGWTNPTCKVAGYAGKQQRTTGAEPHAGGWSNAKSTVHRS